MKNAKTVTSMPDSPEENEHIEHGSQVSQFLKVTIATIVIATIGYVAFDLFQAQPVREVSIEPSISDVVYMTAYPTAIASKENQKAARVYTLDLSTGKLDDSTDSQSLTNATFIETTEGRVAYGIISPEFSLITGDPDMIQVAFDTSLDTPDEYGYYYASPGKLEREVVANIPAGKVAYVRAAGEFNAANANEISSWETVILDPATTSDEPIREIVFPGLISPVWNTNGTVMYGLANNGIHMYSVTDGVVEFVQSTPTDNSFAATDKLSFDPVTATIVVTEESGKNLSVYESNSWTKLASMIAEDGATYTSPVVDQVRRQVAVTATQPDGVTSLEVFSLPDLEPKQTYTFNLPQGEEFIVLDEWLSSIN